MANNITELTITGNLVGDPELRFTPAGAAVANFTVASTPRTFDKQANEWKDGETLFMRCAAWRALAENVAETLTKGMAVVVKGTLVSRPYETKEGEKRVSVELTVDDIGPSLKWMTGKMTRSNRQGTQGGQGGGFGGGQASGGGGGWGGAQGGQQGGGGDPWAGGQSSNAGGSWGGGGESEPPF
ncbi:ssDNA-binding protein [Arthrobacter phage Abba]|uniref:SsDNA-binding protein n=1 Tax=Arthrobacter phage Abba TaxID=2713256 RepID=A0A6G8R2G0_9CAUD|nr:ssDNA binding protein [Arthrobacter phage Abba]QIN94366.1 ssDNA-binding protein [Arthrobacter phage Abba]